MLALLSVADLLAFTAVALRGLPACIIVYKFISLLVRLCKISNLSMHDERRKNAASDPSCTAFAGGKPKEGLANEHPMRGVWFGSIPRRVSNLGPNHICLRHGPRKTVDRYLVILICTSIYFLLVYRDASSTEVEVSFILPFKQKP